MCASLVRATPPSFNPPTVLWRLAAGRRGKGRDLRLESISLTTVQPGFFFFCQKKAKNILEKDHIVQRCRRAGVCPASGRVQRKEDRGEAVGFYWTVLKGYRSMCESVLVLISPTAGVSNWTGRPDGPDVARGPRVWDPCPTVSCTVCYCLEGQMLPVWLTCVQLQHRAWMYFSHQADDNCLPVLDFSFCSSFLSGSRNDLTHFLY